MTSGRMRRLAAMTMIGLAFSACADGDRRDKADAPATGASASSVGPAESSQPPPTTPGDARSDFGLADVAAGVGAGPGSISDGTPGAPRGGATGSGGSGAAGGSLARGGSAGGATTAGGAAAPGGADTASGSDGGSSGTVTGGPSGGSGAGKPKFAATPEDCARLRQVMAIVDHPDLHQLKADAGC